MSTPKGKRYEREVARKLRARGWTVERVTGSGGFTGTSDCDLVMLPPEVEAVDEVPLADHPMVIRAEVKFSSKASGFAKVYSAHGRLWGLDLRCGLSWEGQVVTTGLDGLTAYHEGTDDHLVTHRLGESPPAVMAKWLEGKAGRQRPDLAMMRGARKSWVVAWRLGRPNTKSNEQLQLEATR